VTLTTIDVESLYVALDRKREAEKLSWRGLAQELGVAPSTFTRMVQGRRPDADTFAAMVRWLGLPMDQFVTGGHEPDPLDMIGTYLRMDRHITAEAASALEEAIRAMYSAMRKKAL
jgi:transcriptional regulator with XRE-family HTH domain